MAKCTISVVSQFEVYDSGNEIGVLFRESANGYHHYPIAFQGSIEDTYNLARLTCEVLNSFANGKVPFPKYLDQFIESLSDGIISREEYLTDLRLFLQFGYPDKCGQCRFFCGDKPCKHQYPTASPSADDDCCACGIRNEQNNG